MELKITKTDKNFEFVGSKDDLEITLPMCASEKLEEGNVGFRPTDVFLYSVGGCMSIDIVHILGRQRQVVNDYSMKITSERFDGTPSYFTKVIMHVDISGDIKEEKLQEAIRLSEEKYCSVYHSMRQDLVLEVTYTINPSK